MKLKLFISFLLLFSFAGCSKTTAFTFFDMSEEKELSISNSQAARILGKNNRSELVLNTVYLNSVFPKEFHNDENIFISAYFINDNDFCENTKETSECYSVQLNNTQPTEVIKISKDDTLAKSLSLKEKWGEYYIFKFHHIEDEKLKLKISKRSNAADSVSIEFEKSHL